MTRASTPARNADERGVSLPEVLVSMALLSLVLATVYSGIFVSSDTITGTGERLRNLEEARALVSVTTKDLRTAVRLQAGTSPFLLADDRETIFYGNLDTTDAPKKVRIRVDGSSQLVEEVWDADVGSTAPDYTYTGSPRIRYVGRFVANGSDAPIFEYLDKDGNVLTGTPLSASDRLAIKAVRVTLEVRRTSAFNDNTTTVVNQVRLPNLDYNAVAG